MAQVVSLAERRQRAAAAPPTPTQSQGALTHARLARKILRLPSTYDTRGIETLVDQAAAAVPGHPALAAPDDTALTIAALLAQSDALRLEARRLITQIEVIPANGQAALVDPAARARAAQVRQARNSAYFRDVVLRAARLRQVATSTSMAVPQILRRLAAIRAANERNRR